MAGLTDFEVAGDLVVLLVVVAGDFDEVVLGGTSVFDVTGAVDFDASGTVDFDAGGAVVLDVAGAAGAAFGGASGCPACRTSPCGWSRNEPRTSVPCTAPVTDCSPGFPPSVHVSFT